MQNHLVMLKTIAAAQYTAGADIIYQAAGGTGAGVFNEAKSINETRNESAKSLSYWCDRDQEATVLNLKMVKNLTSRSCFYLGKSWWNS